MYLDCSLSCRCSTLNPLSGGSLHSLPTAAFHTSCAVPQVGTLQSAIHSLNSALHCTAQDYTTLHNTTFHYKTLQFTTLHYITLHSTTMHSIALLSRSCLVHCSQVSVQFKLISQGASGNLIIQPPHGPHPPGSAGGFCNPGELELHSNLNLSSIILRISCWENKLHDKIIRAGSTIHSRASPRQHPYPIRECHGIFRTNIAHYVSKLEVILVEQAAWRSSHSLVTWKPPLLDELTCFGQTEFLKRPDTRTHVCAKFSITAQNIDFGMQNRHFFVFCEQFDKVLSNVLCFLKILVHTLRKIIIN